MARANSAFAGALLHVDAAAADPAQQAQLSGITLEGNFALAAFAVALDKATAQARVGEQRGAKRRAARLLLIGWPRRLVVMALLGCDGFDLL